MKAIITGLNGTVAPATAATFRERGIEVVAWKRYEVSIENIDEMRGFLHREQPDWFLHIATGPPQWAESVSRLCAEESIRFLFTSSVSVFSEHGTGPYTVDDEPTATDDYGRY